MIRGGRPVALPADASLHLCRTQQPFDACAATAHALPLQLRMHAWTTLGAPALPEDGLNVAVEVLITLGAMARPSSLRRVASGPRHATQAAHARDRKLVLVGADTGVLHRDSVAKYAAAFLRKSRSWRKTSFSRRRRCSSAAWRGC